MKNQLQMKCPIILMAKINMLEDLLEDNFFPPSALDELEKLVQKWRSDLSKILSKS